MGRDTGLGLKLDCFLLRSSQFAMTVIISYEKKNS